MNNLPVAPAMHRCALVSPRHQRLKWIGSASVKNSCVTDYYTCVAMSTDVENLMYCLPMSSETPLFSSWLREEIGRHGWQPADFAREADTSTANVTRWLQGKQPSTQLCQKIAAALGWPVEYVLFRAGHLDHLPQPASAYERERTIRALHDTVDRFGEVTPSPDVRVRFQGRVPADAIRWVSYEHEDRYDQVQASWLRGESPEHFFVVETSGDCLRGRGIINGSRVLLKRTYGNEPPSGSIVLVRFGDEYTLKQWHRNGDWIELRDGDDNTIHRFSMLEEFEVVGVRVADWRLD